MSYRALTLEEAVDYAKKLPNLFPEDADLDVREIGDGNLNLVFHITDKTSDKSIIMKQALPYAKVVGESWPLTLDRARIESEVLKLEHGLCPELVPFVYTYDKELALTVMEDLSDHVIMRKGLIEGNRYPLFAEHIGEFMARTLFYTSDLGMNQQEKKLQQKQFINPELCKITEDLIFDDPYTDSPNNSFNPLIKNEVEQIWNDHELHLHVADLRKAFLTRGEALLHGDLHTGSIFITEQSTKVIDPEFAYYGPMGFDIGAIIANLLLNAAGQEGWKTDAADKEAYRSYLIETVKDIWNEFHSRFVELWNKDIVDRISQTPGYQERYMKQLLKDTAGFAGCKMVRRIIGLAHVADIDTIPDAEVRAKAERMALQIGTALIKQHQEIETIEDVIAIAQHAWNE